MKLKTLMLSSLAAIAATTATPAMAVTNFFTDFDSYSVPFGGYVIIPSVEGWTATAGDGIELQNHAAGTPFSSPNLVELDSNNNSEMSRMIDAGSYVLDWYYSARPGEAAETNPIRIIVDSVGSAAITLSGIGNTDTQWVHYQAFFTTQTSTFLRFRAEGTSDSLGGYLDNINLVGTAVPEPSTWAMLIFGFGLVGFVSRRRRSERLSFA